MTDEARVESGDERDSESDNREDDLDRTDRFVETGENPEFFKSKSLSNLKPFYNGSVLDNRMTEIRKSIYYIRQNWSEFDTFLTTLKQLLLENGSIEFKDETTRKHAERLFTSKRDWMTGEAVRNQDVSFEAVKLYTSKEGHSRIYRVSNQIFRHEDSVVSVEMIRSVVFLVELINIDLFNYCLKCPQQSNFQGVVYRGLCLTDADLAAFKTLRDEPISKRNIAVPLGLFSASSSLKVARKFIKHQLKDVKSEDTTLKPLVVKVHVIGLKPEYINHYSRRFPSAVLTTICAVDIHKLSRHPKEMEVLLRGPFMLILDMYEDELDILGKPCNILEAVMLNANRDHISTSFLGDLDTLARDMFAAMVTVTRSEFALKFCQEKGLGTDENEYRTILQESSEKLRNLLKE
ncbi:uncharacterized protein LOC123536534 [Mercenaria mercenaria]|uniref:uncharacterized protein LOC123536534 n=1 Tax=Mercenaria mercenaria TaxID=6596 RepID=UPI00234E9CD0|nr:uncharacterized protein LOC123536534 [Mercenaria mercenaria]